jgi:hypothetical protein
MRSFLRPPPRKAGAPARSRSWADDVFAAGEQPRGEVAAETFGVLHSPAPLRPLPRPAQHASVLAQRRVDLNRGNFVVGVRGDRRRGVGALVGSIPISIIGDGLFLLGRVKGSAADNPTSRYPFASASSSRLC